VSVTVLIVDDHPTFRRFARRVLEEAGFSVVAEAADGAAAVAETKALRPAAVLLDVVLPDVSGLEVAAALAALPDRPAVVLTSSRSAEDLGHALSTSPADAFIPKEHFSGPAFARVLEDR
jgi:CheY-like chemotaxis protein